MHLNPLSATEVRSLVSAIRPAGLSEAELSRIVERAAENGFFAEELVSATEHAGSGDMLPGELAELPLIRLDRLSEPAAEVVRLAAVAGGRMGTTTVQLTGQPAGELEAALRETVDAHVLEAIGDAGYAFRPRCSAKRSMTICCPVSG